MLLSTTNLLLSKINSISIPTDALLVITILICITSIVYFFNHLLDDQTHNLNKKIDKDLNLPVIKENFDDQSTLDTKTINQSKARKLNLLSSQLLGLGGFALLIVGGSSLIALQTTEKSYIKINKDEVKMISVNKSKKSLLSSAKDRPIARTKRELKKINYFEPYLSTTSNYKYYKVNPYKINNYFAF